MTEESQGKTLYQDTTASWRKAFLLVQITAMFILNNVFKFQSSGHNNYFLLPLQSFLGHKFA